MSNNIVRFFNLQAQRSYQFGYAFKIGFSASTGLDPVVTGGSNLSWTSNNGGTTATGGTPSPALDASGLWTVTADDVENITAIVADADTVTEVMLTPWMTSLATLTLTDNAGLDVDALIANIYEFRAQLPAMTVNVGGTCPTPNAQSRAQILDLTSNYSHNWTFNSDLFAFTVKTDNTGTSNDDQFTIPLPGSGTYDFTVYGAGVEVSHTANTDLTLTFPGGAGTYGLLIDGVFPRIYFNNGGDKLKLTGLTQFGDVGWGTIFQGAFQGCAIVGTIPTLPDNLTNTNSAFRYCSGVTGIPTTLPNSLTDGRLLYAGCTSILGSIPTIPAGLVNANSMFNGCSLITGTLPDWSIADGSLTSVSETFSNCSGLTGNSIDFWNWTTPPTSTSGCYTGCTSLTDYGIIPSEYGGGGVPIADHGYSQSRVIFAGYTGNIIEVERASDNTKLDIAGDANGDLDTAAIVAFCSGTNGFIRTEYDQYGGIDKIQSIHASQPKIYDSVTGINLENGKPAGKYDGIDDYMDALIGTLTQPNTYFTVANQGGINARVIFDSTTGARNILWTNGNNWSMYAGTFLDGSTMDANQHIFSSLFNGASSFLYIDGVSNAIGNAGTQSQTNLRTGAGLGTPASFLNGNRQEIYVYNSDKTANRAAIESSLNAYYGTY